MEQNAQNKELNLGSLHLLLGEIITVFILFTLFFIAFSHPFQGWDGVIIVYPIWFFSLLFLIYTVSGLFSSFKKIKLYKSNNLQIPKSLKILRILSVILIILPFLCAFIFLKYYLNIPIVF